MPDGSRWDDASLEAALKKDTGYRIQFRIFFAVFANLCVFARNPKLVRQSVRQPAGDFTQRLAKTAKQIMNRVQGETRGGKHQRQEIGLNKRSLSV